MSDLSSAGWDLRRQSQANRRQRVSQSRRRNPDSPGNQLRFRLAPPIGYELKMSSGRNAETTKLGTSTTSLILRSTATLHSA